MPRRVNSLAMLTLALGFVLGSVAAGVAQDAGGQLVDGWRRTAQGWERLSGAEPDKLAAHVPSEHVALVQVWPAAWAACLVLSVLGLAAAGTEGKQIDARPAGGDQVGYDLSRAT